MYSDALCMQVKRFEFQIKTHFLVSVQSINNYFGLNY